MMAAKANVRAASMHGLPSLVLGAWPRQAPLSCAEKSSRARARRRRPDVDGQSVGLGHIAGDEVRATLHQVGNKSDRCGPAGPRRAINRVARRFRHSSRAQVVGAGSWCRRPLSISVTRPRAGRVDLASDGLTCASRPSPLAPWRSVETRNRQRNQPRQRLNCRAVPR